jgi:hypothetical protein
LLPIPVCPALRRGNMAMSCCAGAGACVCGCAAPAELIAELFLFLLAAAELLPAGAALPERDLSPAGALRAFAIGSRRACSAVGGWWVARGSCCACEADEVTAPRPRVEPTVGYPCSRTCTPGAYPSPCPRA